MLHQFLGYLKEEVFIMDNTLLNLFGERLSELMKDEEINGINLGKKLGVSRSTVPRWIKGTRKIGLKNFIKVADYFNCTMDFLAGRSYEDIKFVPQTPPPFPHALKRALESCGKSRHYLDKYTKIKDSYLHNWYHGVEPDILSLVDLAEILGCTIDFLVGREN